MRCRGLIALLIWGQSVAAADLGTWGDLCRRFYGADGYRSADVRREKRCEISRWCYSLPEYPAS